MALTLPPSALPRRDELLKKPDKSKDDAMQYGPTHITHSYVLKRVWEYFKMLSPTENTVQKYLELSNNIVEGEETSAEGGSESNEVEEGSLSEVPYAELSDDEELSDSDSDYKYPLGPPRTLAEPQTAGEYLGEKRVTQAIWLNNPFDVAAILVGAKIYENRSGSSGSIASDQSNTWFAIIRSIQDSTNRDKEIEIMENSCAMTESQRKEIHSMKKGKSDQSDDEWSTVSYKKLDWKTSEWAKNTHNKIVALVELGVARAPKETDTEYELEHEYGKWAKYEKHLNPIKQVLQLKDPIERAPKTQCHGRTKGVIEPAIDFSNEELSAVVHNYFDKETRYLKSWSCRTKFAL
jgi:hypothetical protein